MPATAALTAPSPATHWAELLSHRAYLVRFAQRKLQDPALAEDVVHDVFEAVLRGRAAFAGASALRTWLTGVLKHKIVDLVRQRSGHDSLEACAAGNDEHDEDPWALECPQPRPEEITEQRQRLQHTMARIGALPDALRRVVEMRLLHERSSEEVCSALQISEQNLFVRLHRARRALAS